MSSKAFGRFCRTLVLCVIGLSVNSCVTSSEIRQISAENTRILEAYTNWAALLRKMDDNTNAAAVESRAKKLEQAFRAPLSTYIDFNPSDELETYANNLREAARGEEANDMQILAQSYKATQLRNVKSHGARVWDVYRYYAPKDP